MSRAFVKEDGPPPPEAAEQLPDRPAALQPITAAGYARFEAELRDAPAASRRARLLAQILGGVEITATHQRADGGAGFGCYVDVQNEEGVRARYELVGPDEADAAQGRISIASPMGRALLGAREGDTLRIHRPKGDLQLRVLRVDR